MVGFQCFLENPSLTPALAQCAGEGLEPSAEPGVQLVFPGYSVKFTAGLGCSLVSVSGAVLSVHPELLGTCYPRTQNSDSESLLINLCGE